jgi:hypothetical protein
MERQFSFEKLRVWQEARDLVREIYGFTLQLLHCSTFQLINS